MRTQIKTYTFTPGTRQITVTDDITFTKADIAIIVNRTQQKVLFTIPDYNLITDVTNKVITYDNSLPVLAEGDVLWIEIDIEVTATKIVREDPIVTEVNGEYHPNDYNLVYELAQHIPNDYPYCYIVKFSKDQSDIALSGADAYYLSDGTFYEVDTNHSFNDWDNGKIARYVIYCKANRDTNVLFSVIGINNIIEMLFDDINIVYLTMNNSSINKVWSTSKTTFSPLCQINFASSSIRYADFPSLVISDIFTFTLAGSLKYLGIPNMTHFSTLTVNSAFASCGLRDLHCPSLVKFSNRGSTGEFRGATFNVVYIGNSYNSTQVNEFTSISTVYRLVLENGFDSNFYIAPLTLLTAADIYNYMIPNLKDNTGLTAKTITFATVVYNALNTAGYLPLFTAKNWNVASA